MIKDLLNGSGLYIPEMEKDACGVGLIANLKNKSSHKIIDSALQMLANMEHRGACGCEENTGDGAGILCFMPDGFFRQYFAQKEIVLPQKGQYGVGMFFLPKDTIEKEHIIQIIQHFSHLLDFKIIENRWVPCSNQDLGKTALETEPDILQLFFKTSNFNYQDIEKRLFFLRHLIEKNVHEKHPDQKEVFCIASLSSKTIIYKGLLKATQLRYYYDDLQDPEFQSSMAIVHSRFSTNTLPKWKLAQPFHSIAHNGEINTIQGNLKWWNAKEKAMLKEENPSEYCKLFPICDPTISDSGNFDRVVSFLEKMNGSIARTIMMMIPEAWQNDAHIEKSKRAFYQYHESIMEPWDGPASICFTDGRIVGATLDRNGLRPSRYLLTNDDLLILASEAGCINVDPSTVIKKGRLQPGKIVVADLDEQRIITDEELKETICKQKPYQQWLDQNTLNIQDFDSPFVATSVSSDLHTKQRNFGYSQEDEKMILGAMVETKKEAIGSMGADIPLAILSNKPQHLTNYFKQQFAQVTNPPIDSLREKYYMSLQTSMSGQLQWTGLSEIANPVLTSKSPIISKQIYAKLAGNQVQKLPAHTAHIVYTKGTSMLLSMESICEEIHKQIVAGKRIICLSDETVSREQVAIPSLLMVSNLHHYLMGKGNRKEISLIVYAGDVWETHHAACLLSFGADLICPYLAFESIVKISIDNQLDVEKSVSNYQYALEKGLLKILSKLGISTLMSYKGAQTFEALGISKKVINKSFPGTISRIEGLRFEDIQKETEIKHAQAYEAAASRLEQAGVFQWRRDGEYHLFNPQTIHLLQHATELNRYDTYKKFANEIDQLEKNNSTLRSYLRIKKSNTSLNIDEVESVEKILKRFATGAMSFGSISEEAHMTLAIAMNRIGGKSNSGEGGEDKKRFTKLPNGDSAKSAIKQVASGRFGVDMEYLESAKEIQIKMAQGAKPGEGGQLPGHKVDENIARVRNATPGVGLISPPPHHDIYSIEDLAQLIFDLKNANKRARISVKLVSKAGVGVIASGVTKAHADHILISGHDGGTGASPLSSIRHAGVPWELGLSETHQTLMKNGLRNRVVLQTDGQIRTGRDMAIATILGAEEWGIATAALVVEGCILMRKCHLNTCPVGIATQDKTLREKFAGKVENLIHYFTFLAQHLREILAEVGLRSVNELVGRTDLIEIADISQHWKTRNLNLEAILHQESHPNNISNYACVPQDHGLDKQIDNLFIAEIKENHKNVHQIYLIKSTDRAVGTMLSNYLIRLKKRKDITPKLQSYYFKGSAGQSFCAFGVCDLHFSLEGDANDYLGKGLSGARIAVYPDKTSMFQAENQVIIGNVALYGATSGEVYINGMAGDRFCVRNSGASAVVEGVGENACEYMTGGVVVNLGELGRNFAAGMSGGFAYLYDVKPHFYPFINHEMVTLENPDVTDLLMIKELLKTHIEETGSPKARKILDQWDLHAGLFTKVYPKELKKVLETESVSNVRKLKAG